MGLAKKYSHALTHQQCPDSMIGPKSLTVVHGLVTVLIGSDPKIPVQCCQCCFLGNSVGGDVSFLNSEMYE